MNKFKHRSSTDFPSSSTVCIKPRGFYDDFVQTCVRNARNIAMRMYDEGKYTCYTYSELFGVCEYIAQNLQQLNCNRGVVGLISRTNIIVPCALAAAHKCCTGFMFLDPLNDLVEVTKDIQFSVIISIHQNSELTGSTTENLSKKPDKVITVFDHTLSFYNKGPSTDTPTYRNMVEHSFLYRTSGSTGQPKNVQVPISCIQPNIDDLTSLFQIRPEDVIFFSTPLTFDPSMVEILLALKNGASLLIAPDKADILFPDNKEHSVTVWQTTPSKFFQHTYTDLKTRILSANSTLKVLALGGEPFKGLSSLKQAKDARNQTKIFSLYGVTEMSCWACAAELDINKYSTDREIPLGQSLSETQVIVKPDTKESSEGKIILVSKTRKCVIVNKDHSRGEQNSLKFIDTGDLGQVNNGTIYYRGRTDDQVKRFGHKINLLFIESIIHQCPKVKACSCVWLQKPRLLVVYFTSETIRSKELSDFLKCKLDDKHWPDKIIRINTLPTNPHGKTSKIMLRKLYNNTPPTIDSLKLKLLQEIRSFHDGTYDDIKNKNFYAIGGTSFRAVTICNKISLSDPQFGKFLLTHLMAPKTTIDQIMSLAEKTFCREDSVSDLPNILKSQKMVKSTRTAKRSASTLCRESSSSVTKRPFKKALSHVSAVNDVINDDMEMTLLWSYDTGKCVDASPSLWEDNLNLYVTVGSHSGKVVVLDALQGTWCGTIETNSRIEAAVYCYHDDHDSCTYGIVGTYDGTIVCFRLDSCELKWRTNIGSMVKSKATMCTGSVYVAAYDGYITCLDLMTGQVKQFIEISKNQAITADLVLAQEHLVLTGTMSGMCACVDTRTNTVVWRVALTSPIFASPVLYDHDKCVVFAEVSGTVICLNSENGIKIWKYTGAKGNIFSSCYITEVSKQTWRITFGCHDNDVYCITVKEYVPSLSWKCPLSSPVYSTPTGLSNTMVVAASTNGQLNVIDVEHGKVLLNYHVPGETFSSPVVFRDYIYIGCRDDQLYALKLVLKSSLY